MSQTPKPGTGGAPVKRIVALPTALRARLDTQAERAGVSGNALIVRLLDQAVVSE